MSGKEKISSVLLDDVFEILRGNVPRFNGPGRRRVVAVGEHDDKEMWQGQKCGYAPDDSPVWYPFALILWSQDRQKWLLAYSPVHGKEKVFRWFHSLEEAKAEALQYEC